jgi:hypothetical protein
MIGHGANLVTGDWPRRGGFAIRGGAGRGDEITVATLATCS